MTYNGIQLPLPITTSFRQEAVYEESQTDWYCTRFTIGVQCVLNVAYLEITTGPNTVPFQNPAQIMNVLRSLLLKPRKTLSFKVQGVEMIPLAEGGILGTVDAQNGPQPKHCLITQLTPTTFLLDYLVVAHYWVSSPGDGTATNNAGSPVLFNRWTEVVDFDDLQFTRRTREGEIRIRSDNVQGLTPDSLRDNLANLSVPYNFLRKSSRYELSKDGLSLRYRIVDQEVYKMPPAGAALSPAGICQAFRAEGEYEEFIGGKQKQFRVISVRVRLYGNRATDQNDLVVYATTIGMGKLQENLGVSNTGKAATITATLGTQKTINPYSTNLGIKVWMYDNIVEFTAQTLANLHRERISKVPGYANTPIVYTPLSDAVDAATNKPPYSHYGVAQLFMRAASYWDPNMPGVPTLVPGQGATLGNSLVTGATSIGQFPNLYMPGPGILPGQAGTKKEA